MKETDRLLYFLYIKSPCLLRLLCGVTLNVTLIFYMNQFKSSLLLLIPDIFLSSSFIYYSPILEFVQRIGFDILSPISHNEALQANL